MHVFNLTKYFQISLQSGYDSLYHQKQCLGVPVSHIWVKISYYQNFKILPVMKGMF